MRRLFGESQKYKSFRGNFDEKIRKIAPTSHFNILLILLFYRKLSIKTIKIHSKFKGYSYNFPILGDTEEAIKPSRPWTVILNAIQVGVGEFWDIGRSTHGVERVVNTTVNLLTVEFMSDVAQVAPVTVPLGVCFCFSVQFCHLTSKRSKLSPLISNKDKVHHLQRDKDLSWSPE